MLVTDTVAALTIPTAAEMDRWRAMQAGREAHAPAYAGAACLRQVELVQPPRPAAAPPSLRVMAWNAERLIFLEDAIRLIQDADPDVVLLSEVDCGMGRSGNRHNIAAVAAALGYGYAYGVEFIELGLGDPREVERTGATHNTMGLHGGGILSRLPLLRPAMVRFPVDELWFTGLPGQRRVGGRIALLAQVQAAGRTVTLAAPHLESHAGPGHRGAQMQYLLERIGEYAPGGPALIGGDVNSNTHERDDPRPTDGARLANPQPYEPMFAAAADSGYDWAACNLPGVPTQRTRPDGRPQPPFAKLDWFFARGLKACDCAVLPAVSRGGGAISDHEPIAVTIR